MLEVLDGLTVLDPSLVPVGVVVPLPQQRPAAAAAEEPQAKRQKVVDGERGAGCAAPRGPGLWASEVWAARRVLPPEYCLPLLRWGCGTESMGDKW